MTKREALAFAAKYNLEEEVEKEIDNGLVPEDALSIYDIL